MVAQRAAGDGKPKQTPLLIGAQQDCFERLALRERGRTDETMVIPMWLGTSSSKQDAATRDPTTFGVRAPRGPVQKLEDGPKWFLLPESSNKLKWDILSIVLLVWTVIVSPIKFGFDVADRCASPMWIMDAVVDIFFMVDLLLTFVTATYITNPKTSEEVLTRNPRLIARKYLRGWFIIDLASSLPIHTALTLAYFGCDANLVEGTGAPSLVKLVRILRVVKLLKLVRILKLGQLLDDMTDSLAVSIDMSDQLKLQLPLILKAFQILLTMLYLTHIMACGFYYVGAREYFGRDEAEDSWIARAVARGELQLVREVSVLEWHELSPPYVASLYWTCTTVTTVGYGDIAAVTTNERIYAIFCLIFGTVLFGYVMGSATALINASSGTSRNAFYHKRLQSLQWFMTRQKLPQELQTRIRRYFRFYWKHCVVNTDADDEIMQTLSDGLRRDTLRFLQSSTIAQMPVFQIVPDESFQGELLQSMRPIVCCPNDDIIQEGTRATEFFLMSKGQAGVFYRPNSRGRSDSSTSLSLGDVAHLATGSTARLVATLGPGALLGEIALLKPSDLGVRSMTNDPMLKREGPRLRTATVSALDFCEVFVVEAHAFLAILSNFEPFKIHVVQLAKSRLKELDDVDVLLKSGKSSRSLKWLSQARSSINSKDEANGGESPSVLSAPPKPSLRSATEVGAADGAGACAVAGAVAGASASTVEIAAVVSAALRQEIRGLHERIADTVKEVKQIKEMMLADTVNQLKKEVQVAFASSLSTTDGVHSRLSGSTISATDQGTSS
ncbi:cyclic nucleotide-binding protein [Chrysochromulina tobinii]|uniref:Cyclic nucleotide-binding protein n=1 Tax=Chrysochromulina tobinii TaxID=1460289 RepID=A0A0M0JEC2_9EUKA|nr:cyclic nucleotide-binding protein [Chrysochromulina tobinii]|eukprot:KOO24573.1 cyclic nucleotide-binding protein [Chrysochromulina sp. CCMP291]